MKKRVKKQGFAMILLIFFISMIGIETVTLSGISGTMAFETNQTYLQACRENLIVSGLAWAKENADKAETNEATDLDITSLGLRNAELRVTVNITGTGRREANVTALCSVARQRLRTDNTYSF
jgi:hypothetical protein